MFKKMFNFVINFLWTLFTVWNSKTNWLIQTVVILFELHRRILNFNVRSLQTADVLCLNISADSQVNRWKVEIVPNSSSKRLFTPSQCFRQHWSESCRLKSITHALERGKEKAQKKSRWLATWQTTLFALNSFYFLKNCQQNSYWACVIFSFWTIFFYSASAGDFDGTENSTESKQLVSKLTMAFM